METCTGADTQLWRLDQGGPSTSMRFRAETVNMCLAARGGSGSDVVAELCQGPSTIYLPWVANTAAGLTRASTTPGVISHGASSGGQDLYLIDGGQIRLPSRLGGTQYCLDVHDVWDSQFTSGYGGPEPGQRVQIFECHTSQLNQRWNLTGDVMSVNKCLTMSGNATANGANATVQTCDDSEEQDWDYYW